MMDFCIDCKKTGAMFPNRGNWVRFYGKNPIQIIDTAFKIKR